MTRTMFEDISTDIEQKGDQYQVVLKIVNDIYRLEAVDTKEQAENIRWSVQGKLLVIHQKVFFQRLNESKRQYLKTFVIVFGSLVFFTVIMKVDAIPDQYKLFILTATLFGMMFYFFYELRSMKPPPILPDDDVLLSLISDTHKNP